MNGTRPEMKTLETNATTGAIIKQESQALPETFSMLVRKHNETNKKKLWKQARFPKTEIPEDVHY